MSAGLTSGRTVQVVHKFATGQPIPVGAVYLNTVTQTSIEGLRQAPGTHGIDDVYSEWEPCWLVWHYFLVEVPA